MSDIQKKTLRGSLLTIAALVLTASFAVLAGCDDTVQAQKTKPAEQAKTPAAEAGDAKVIAQVGDAKITEQEVEEKISAQLTQLEQQRRQLLEQGLEQAINQKLVELEAAQRGVTVDELFQEEVQAKITPPTEAEVDAFYEARKAQIGVPKEQVVDRIRQALSGQKQQERSEAFFSDLRQKYEVKSFLDPFRMDVETAGHPAAGPEAAPVTIVEFSDFECPFCSRVVPTLEQVQENYGDKVRLVFRQFPLSQIHPQAQKAAEASLCAFEQGKFWEMHDAMFADQKNLAVDALKEKAAGLGVDAQEFNACLDEGEYADEVAEDLREGQLAGVNSTPSLFVNGRPVTGAVPYEELAKVIDEELSRQGSGSGASDG